MSYYEDERRQYRPAREKRRDSYDDDSVYDKPRTTKSSAVVRRRDSYDSADDEVTRDFPPPDGRGGYYRETVIRKSGSRPARARSYEDDRYYDDRYDNDRTSVGGRRSGRDDRRDRPSRRYSSDYSSRSRSRTPPRRDRRKSKPEEALEALGLGGLAATLLGKKSRSGSRSRDRDRAYSEDRYSSRRGGKGRFTTQEQITQVLKTAILAGAGEAFRSRNEPGGWGGEKGKRVLTAAFSAGGVDGLISQGKNPEEHKTRNAIGSAIAGIATSRLVNGPRSKSRGRGGSPDSRGRRSQSRGGGLGDLAAGGVVAAAAKKAYDSFRGQGQQDRGRQRSRSSSFSSRSRSRSRTSRRRSVSRGVAKGLSAVGLNSAADRVDPGRKSRRYSDDEDDYNRSGRRGYNDYRDDVGNPRSGPINGQARSSSQPRSDWQVGQHEGVGVPANYTLDYGPRHTGDPDTDSDSDLGSSTDEEKIHKKGRNKQIVTAGLATIATIHAGHSVYQSYDKREARKRALREGKITREQAKENRNRDRLQDAASVGLAALGIKGAYSEWKEMKETREEFEEKKEELKRHRSKRAARREKYHNLVESGYLDSGHTNSMPNLHSPQSMAAPPMGSNYFNGPYAPPQYESQNPYTAGPPRQAAAPMYYDDNPYQTAPPPPVAPTPPYPPTLNHTRSEPPPPPNENYFNLNHQPQPGPETQRDGGGTSSPKKRDLSGKNGEIVEAGAGDVKGKRNGNVTKKDKEREKHDAAFLPKSIVALELVEEVGGAVMDSIPTP